MPGDGLRGGFEPPEPPVPKGLDGFPFGNKLKITIVVVCGLILVVLCAPLVGLKPWGPVKSFYGLDISLSKPVLTGDNLSGTFKIYYRPFGYDSNATGGACLIGDIASLVPAGWDVVTGSCTTIDDCNPKQPIGAPAKRYFGYCVPEPNKKSNRCWYKPDGPAQRQVCTKSKWRPADPTEPSVPWPIGENVPVPNVPIPPATPFDVHAFYAANTGGRPAAWRLAGRLNVNGAPAYEPYGKPELIK